MTTTQEESREDERSDVPIAPAAVEWYRMTHSDLPAGDAHNQRKDG